MRKNTYKLNNIDCAACALKIEDGVNKLDGVYSSSLNYMTLKFSVTFDDDIVSDEDIEACIHKSLSGVEILQKNNNEFIDNYQEQGIIKKMLYRGRRK